MKQSQAEPQLKEARQILTFLEALLQASVDGIVITDPFQNIIRVNDAFCSLFSCRQQDIFDTSMYIWIEKFDNDAPLKWIELKKHVLLEGSCRDFEFQVTTREGVRYLSVNASIMETSGDEEKGTIISIWRDVTTRRQAENALHKAHDKLEKRIVERTSELTQEIEERKLVEEKMQESEEKYRTVMESNPDPVVVYDMAGNVLYFNPAFQKVFGWTLEERVGNNMDIFVPSEEWPSTQLLIGKAKAGESFSGVESRRFTKTGNIVDVSLSGANYLDSTGEPIGTVVSLRNITIHKRLEAQLRHNRKMEAMGTLAGGIAHDFNNSLHVISGFTQLLLLTKQEENPEFEYVKEIEKAVQRSSELTQQLLTFGRKVESKLRPVNLNFEIKQVKNLLGRIIPKMIRIDVGLQKNLKIINADPGQIEQVLMNISINAKHAMPEGGQLSFKTEIVSLDQDYCEIHLGATPGEYVLLTITDTGHGMDNETLKHIFDPFFTTKEAGEGTGLGLAMVYGIVKNHGGYIMCYTQQDQGTVFRIYFPVLETTDLAQEEIVNEDETPGGVETVLLVDDEASAVLIGKSMLERFGYRTLTAENGETAVEIYQSRHQEIGLVILDMGMPGMGGHQCFLSLRHIDPKVKVIVSSGYPLTGKMKETLDAGASAFIGKPYQLKDLLRIVRDVLDRG